MYTCLRSLSHEHIQPRFPPNHMYPHPHLHTLSCTTADPYINPHQASSCFDLAYNTMRTELYPDAVDIIREMDHGLGDTTKLNGADSHDPMSMIFCDDEPIVSVGKDQIRHL